jgi:hypothetical protein
MINSVVEIPRAVASAVIRSFMQGVILKLNWALRTCSAGSLGLILSVEPPIADVTTKIESSLTWKLRRTVRHIKSATTTGGKSLKKVPSDDVLPAK